VISQAIHFGSNSMRLLREKDFSRSLFA